MAFSPVKARAHARGVVVSPRPRKMPFVASQSVAAGAPSEQMRRYASAEGYMADAGVTRLRRSTPRANTKKKAPWTTPTTRASSSAVETALARTVGPSPSLAATSEMVVRSSGSL